MARDALRDVFPVNVDFVAGEQPGSPKFDGWAEQTNNGLAFVSGAIGDIWGDEFGSNKLYPHRARPANISNMARLLGPASALNPMRQPRQSLNASIDLSAGDIPADVNEFQLPVVPIEFYGIGSTDPDKALHRPDSSVAAGTIFDLLTTLDPVVFNPANRKSSRDLVAAFGDWHIDMMGRVYTYAKTGNYLAALPAVRTYTAQMHWEFHDYQRNNVYPDWQELTVYCTVAETGAGSGVYNVDLPFATKTPRERNLAYGTPQWEPGNPDPSDGLAYAPPEDFQLFLPQALTATIAPGGLIPEGYMQLWDDTTGQIIDNLSFALQTSTRVTCTGAALSAAATFPGSDNTRYRLITVGTTVTESIQELAWKVDNHRHDDKILGGSPIKHVNLSMNHVEPDTVFGSWGTTVYSPPSAIVGNDHPQYMMRYGWQAAVDAGQYDNAMLGDLFMATGHADYTVVNYNSGTATSHAVLFGIAGNYIDATDAGIGYGYNMHIKSLNDTLWLESPDILIGNALGGGPTQANIIWSENLGNKGLLQWNSGSTNETGWSFIQSGSIANAQIQMGHLWVHDQALAQDLSTPPGDYIHIEANTQPGAKIITLKDSFGATTTATLSTDGLVTTLNSDGNVSVVSSAADVTVDAYQNLLTDATNGNWLSSVGGGISFSATSTQFDSSGGDTTLSVASGSSVFFRETGRTAYVEVRPAAGALEQPRVYWYGDGGATDWVGATWENTGRNFFLSAGTADSHVVCGNNMTAFGLPTHDNSVPVAVPQKGYMRYDTTDDKVYVYNGASWRALDYHSAAFDGAD